MSLTSHFRTKRAPRHSRQDDLRQDDRSATEAIAALPDPECFDVPVPAAQRQAERDSGPQQVYATQPLAAPHPVTEPFPQARDWPLAHPQPRPVPQGENPYPYPAQQQERNGHPGPRRMPPTEAYTQEFAHANPVYRPYVPRSPIRALPPALPMLYASRQPQVRQRALAAARARLERLSYPEHDPRDQYGHAEQYAALMRRCDAITGTCSPFGYAGAWSLPSAPEVLNRGLAITAGAASS